MWLYLAADKAHHTDNRFSPVLHPPQLDWLYQKKVRAEKTRRPEDKAALAAARKHASQGSVLAIKSLVDARTNRPERFVALLCPEKEEDAQGLAEALDSCRETDEQPYEWLREFTVDQKREPQWDEPNQMLALVAGGSGAAGRLLLGNMSRPEGHTLSYVPVEKRLQTRRRVRRQGPGSSEIVEAEVPKRVTVKRRAPTAAEERLRESKRERLEKPGSEEEAAAREEEEERAQSPPQRGQTPPPDDDERGGAGGEQEDLFGDADV